jgi:hypothetical protein
MQEIEINEYMAICSNCYHEFDTGETAYIDDDNEYICTDCK